MRIQQILNVARDTRGGAAVEFALITPLIAGAVVLMAQLATQWALSHDMRAAVSSGAQYAMSGSRDREAIRATALAGWKGRPESGVVTVTETYGCGESAGHAGVACADGLLPQIYITVQASADFDSIFADTAVVDQVVRVR